MEQVLVEREQRIRHLNAALNRASGGGTSANPDNGIAVHLCPHAIEYPYRESEKVQELEKKNKQLLSDLETAQKQERFLRIEARKLNEDLNQSKNKNGQ